MESTIIGVYVTDTQAQKANDILRKKGYSSEHIFPVIDSNGNSDIAIEALGPTGAFLGAIIGIVISYVIFFITGFTAVTFTHGAEPFFLSTVVIGIIGALVGGFLGSFFSFGVSEDLHLYKTLLENGASIVAVHIKQEDESFVYDFLQKTGARRIHVSKEKEATREYQNSSASRFLYAGIKGGVNRKKKSFTSLTSSRN